MQMKRKISKERYATYRSSVTGAQELIAGTSGTRRRRGVFNTKKPNSRHSIEMEELITVSKSRPLNISVLLFHMANLTQGRPRF